MLEKPSEKKWWHSPNSATQFSSQPLNSWEIVFGHDLRFSVIESFGNASNAKAVSNRCAVVLLRLEGLFYPS
jgi:hypothetical protein